ncbi:MAG: DNA end-binding protein Ku [Saprospiraceae bacterium]
MDVDEVHPSRFEAVYYVGPNGDIAIQTFNLFRKALLKTNKAGVGRIILRDREDVVLITAQGNGLIMDKLRYPYEIRLMEDVPDLKDAEVDETQLKLAETLIASLDKPFTEIDFEDRYRDALLELVEDKVEGKEIVTLSEESESAPVVDIMDVLKKSVEGAKKLNASKK